ncbi:MAG: Hsp20/alpha crystallin family protein [Gammaproteobacteria bacterium]|nr:Hsp20/alpha crystallin family protein [Gammaproteobacteria bacterium]
MNISRYEPWSMLRRFQDDVNRVLAESANVAGGDSDQSNVVTSHWAPAVDIKEEDKRYVLRADVPGVEPKDIEVTMENGVLTIKGERRHEEAKEGNGYKRVERSYGTFYRRFSLPDSADAEGITASGKNGVLEVSIPKKEKLQPRRISVS